LTPREKHDCTFKLKPGINFNYLGHFAREKDNDTLFNISGTNIGGNVNPGMKWEYAIDISGMLLEGKLHFSFLYNKYEYDKNHMEILAKGFQSHLLAIIRHCSDRKKPTATPYDLGCRISLEELERITGNIGKDVEIRYIYPLSPMQSGMLYHWLKNQRDHAYFEQVVLRIRGTIDRLCLQDSVNRLVERHDILKTLFFYEGLEEPLQIVLKERNLALYYEDISHLPVAESKIYLEEFVEKDKQRGFDLTVDMLMRFSLFKTGPGSYRLVWSFHHIIMDGWCLGIIYRELMQIHEALKERKPLNLETVIPYKNYIQWLSKQDKAKGLNYWRRYLEGFEQRTVLPRIPLGTLSKDDEYKPGELTLELDNQSISALNRVSGGYGVTMNTVFQALWGILLQTYNNNDDVVFGSVVSGRPPEIERIEDMVGLFINTVPARITGLPGERFFQLLKRVQEEAVSSRAYEYLPLADIQSQSPLKGNLIDHIWVFENYPFHEIAANAGIKKEHGQGTLLGFAVEDAESFQQTNYDFNVLVVPRDSERLVVTFSYNARVYETETVNRIGRHFKEILNRVVDNPGIVTREIEILTENERQQILFEFNQPVEFHLENKTIHGLFEEQAARTPDNTAVVAPLPVKYRTYMTYRTYISYRELNKQSNRTAGLLGEKGIQPDTIVAIMVDRSIEMIIGLLGILKAGGAYMPIDPTYPQERIDYMLKDSSAKIFLTGQEIAGFSSPQALSLSEGRSFTNDQLAYVIYTSGTTGRPKGVMIDHWNVVRLMYGPCFILFVLIFRYGKCMELSCMAGNW
jgi:non-ribosomal peptide synthase protein (TIGR01720 family)